MNSEFIKRRILSHFEDFVELEVIGYSFVMFIRHIRTFGLEFLFLLALTHCASKPPEPDWVKQTSRTVDNGYIVYVGTGVDRLLEKARFKAEGEAIGDLVNECSFAPKGARIEDHFEEPGEKKGEIKAYAKIGLTFEECEQAKKATDPTEIKNLANVSLAEELKRYQEMVGAEPEPSDVQVAQGGHGGGGGGVMIIQNNNEYLLARQQIVWEKQYVILAPPGAYAPGTPAYVHYNTVVTQVQPRVVEYEQIHPAVRTMPPRWSAYQRSATFQSQHLQRMNRPAVRPPVRRRPMQRRRRYP
jgi:hypothetical protein